VLTGEEDDTCTGHWCNNQLIGNNWFLMQKIELPAVGKHNWVQITAGNPKNGLNYVGTAYIHNVGNNTYKVIFTFDYQDFPENPSEGDTCKIVVADPIVHWNYTGSGTPFNKAPGKNLKGYVADGVSFITDKTEIDFYLHFSITTYTYRYEGV
jgi:hypothetical protein